MNKTLSKIAILLAIAVALPISTINAQEAAAEEVAVSYDPISISCGPDVESAYYDETVNWNATVSGGDGNYSYSWSKSSTGDSEISGSSESVSKTYSAAGSYGAKLTVTDTVGGFAVEECARVTIIAPLEYVSCVPTEIDSYTGYETTWKVVLKGGIAPYNLSLTGTDGLSGNSLTTKITYTTSGKKDAIVSGIASSDGQVLAGLTYNCTSANVTAMPADLTATCSADKTSIKEGESVTWSANVSGGTAPYSYSWSGTDSLSGTGSIASKTYSAAGTKSATLTVTDSIGGLVAGKVCSSVTVSEKTTTTSGSGGGSSSSSSRSSRTTGSTSTTSTTKTVVTAEVPVNTVTFAKNTVNRPVVANNAAASATASATTSVAKATSTDEGIKQANLLANASAFSFIKDNKIISTIVALLILGLAWFIVFFKRRNKEETPKTN